MGIILTRKRQLAARIEANEGVAETIGPADGGLLVIDPKFNPDVKLFPRAVVSESFSRFRQLPGQRSASLTFQSELKGSGTRGYPPALSKYLRACGFQETINEVAGGLAQTTAGTTDNNLRNGASDNVELAAEYAGGEDVTIFYLRLKQNGAIAAGKKIWLEIQGDSGGLPDGIAIADGVSRKLEARFIPATYTRIGIPMPKKVTVPGTAHHVVLKGDYDASPTNNIAWRSNTVASAGNAETLDASWAELDTEDFEVESFNGTSVVYDPITDNAPSLTMLLVTADDQGNAVLKKIRGARGSVKLASKAGEPLMGEFNFLGVMETVVDGSPLSGVVYDTAVEPAVLLAASMTIGGFAAKIASLELDLANVLALRDDISQAEGYFSTKLAGRDPVGSIDPEEPLIASHDFWGRFLNGTEGILDFTIGSAEGNTVNVNAPKTQYTSIGEGDRNGLATLAVDLALNRNLDAGNDEVKITIT